MKLTKPVAFHIPGDPPHEFNETYPAGTPVKVLHYRDCCAEDQHAFRMRIQQKTHIIVEVGGVARLLEREFVG